MFRSSLLKHWSYRIIAPGVLLRQQYEALKELLHYDTLCHQQLVDLQELLVNKQYEDFARLRKRCDAFSNNVLRMINSLEIMSPASCQELTSYHRKFDFYIRYLLAPPKIDNNPPFCFELHHIRNPQDNLGGKSKHLAIITNELNVPVPRGFSIASSAFHAFIAYNDLRKIIDDQLCKLDINSAESLKKVSEFIIGLIQDSPVPDTIQSEIVSAYDRLSQGDGTFEVAVRSSALSEDSEAFSFAGQFSTKLNVSRKTILSAYKDVIASKYSAQALYYRILNGLGDEETAMAVLVLQMVTPIASGVMYVEPENTHSKKQEKNIQIFAVPGTGENLVGGLITPDAYQVDLLSQEILHDLSTDSHLLERKTLLDLADYGNTIAEFFACSQDIEWAVDDEYMIHILQTRPLKHDQQHAQVTNKLEYTINLPEIVAGCKIGSPGIAAGPVYSVSARTIQYSEIPNDVVLVTDQTPPELIQLFHKCLAVISDKGSKASHFATVAREQNIPFLYNVNGLAHGLETGMPVTVDAYKGIIYDGECEVESCEIEATVDGNFERILREVLTFITPLELTDPSALNFSPGGCRSMHDIIRFCHEKALHSIFSHGKPGTGRGALRLEADIPLDVYLFDVGGGIDYTNEKYVPLSSIFSAPFHALWTGLSHPGVKWKQKPFDWEAFEKVELSGAFTPKQDSFSFASYAVVGTDYLHFNLRFGYHFTIIDVICSDSAPQNHCMLRFAGGGGDVSQKNLRLDFIEQVLFSLGFKIERRGDLLEAKLLDIQCHDLLERLDIVGRLLGASKLMDMVLHDQQMVAQCVKEFTDGKYSFSEQG